MKPFKHAKLSAKKYGGTMQDYMDIHNFIDSTKACVPDVRHRTILHSSWGCWMVEEKFGAVAINSDGKEFSPRDVAEDHIIQDLGFLPTMQDYLQHMEPQEWMGGRPKRRYQIRFDEKFQPTKEQA